MPGKPKGLPKTGGRKLGTPNKITAENRLRIQEMIDLAYPMMKKKLKELSPAELSRFLVSLYEYTTPKLSRTEIKGDESGGGITVIVKSGKEE